MWSARRVSTVMKRMRRGGWGAADAEELVPVSLPRQAARARREMIRSFEGLSGIASPAEGRCYYRRGRPPPETSPLSPLPSPSHLPGEGDSVGAVVLIVCVVMQR